MDPMTVDDLGKLVRQVWLDYCRETDQPMSHSRGAPWEDLTPWEQEVDRRIGTALFNVVRKREDMGELQAGQIAIDAMELSELRKQAGYLDLSQNSHIAVRQLLMAHDVPMAAFIDDHVGNAIWQRDQARQRGDTYRARALVLVKALREEREVSEYLDDIYHQAEDDFTNTVERLAIAEPSLAAIRWDVAAAAVLLLPLLKEKLEDEWEQGNIGQYEYDDGGDWDWKRTWDWIQNTDLPQFDDTVDSVEPTNAWVVAYRAVRDAALPLVAEPVDETTAE